ncbi:hypothetical protein GCM10022377_17170 [Zhihengliuella alba]|uniref:CopC domain-containing protein n=1 Tax=Zhihengliuella alba TaxID=547018 RepID=A0ABP7DD29_9MICC
MHSLRSSRAAAAPASSLRAALAAAFACLAVLAAVALAPAAHAHDQLLSTDPESGAALERSPETIGLTFSGEIQEIGSAFELTAADGTDYPTSAAIERTDVTVTPSDALPAGEYTLSWRVISSDGHPIEGTTANGQAVTFSVAGAPAETGPSESSPAASDAAEPPASQPAGESTAAGAATETQDDEKQDDATQDDAAEQPAGDPMAALWIALAAIAAAALVWIVAAKARRVTEGQKQARASDSDQRGTGGASGDSTSGGRS